MSKFKVGDRVRHVDYAQPLVVVTPEPDATGRIALAVNGHYVLQKAEYCVLIPPKVYADMVLTADGRLLGYPPGTPVLCAIVGRISWDGETLAVEP